tara:strand:+ start:44704 stop:45777 length:1074 start_codon:yes stop_codon:yes gene_type:complete
MKTQFLNICFFLVIGQVFAQSDSLVRSIINHSKEVEEQGNFSYAVDLLSTNVKNYKGSAELRKELAFLYFRGSEYRKSLKHCRKFLRRFEPDEDIYQLVAHNHINKGKPSKAERHLGEGLDKLPNSGLLYTEQGRLAMHVEDYESAINWFEKGIENVPNYAGNYYWASKIYCQSTEEMWGLYYGEIFMNLERFTSRTREISSLLFETLNREIIFYNDTAISVNLCKDANFEVPIEDTANYVSYCQDIIEPNYKKALKGIDFLSIGNIYKFRSKFIQIMKSEEMHGYRKHYLHDFHNDLIKNGHFEAYNHWLFMMGNPEEFQYWEKNNSSQWKLFIRWIENYDFQIKEEDAYFSKQFR